VVGRDRVSMRGMRYFGVSVVFCVGEHERERGDRARCVSRLKVSGYRKKF